MREDNVTTGEPSHPNARHCPTCGTLGILPLDQAHDERGRIIDPMMLCPRCEVEFRATGMT